MKKKNPDAETRQAEINLAPYFEEQARIRQIIAEEGSYSGTRESPFLVFMEPLWGAIPQCVYDQRGPFVIGSVWPKTESERSNNGRKGIWNAATGNLVFAIEGAVDIAWSPDGSWIGVWREYVLPGKETLKDVERSAWGWKFERRTWPGCELTSVCEIETDGYLWPMALEIPKTYQGEIVKLCCRWENGPETWYLKNMGDNLYQEISNEEMKAYREAFKSKPQQRRQKKP